MRFLESILVPAFERKVPILFITRSLLVKIFLGHHVQFRRCRQCCIARRSLSRFLADPIRRPFLRCSAVSGAMRVECRHTAHDKRRDCHHYKKPQRFELSWHDVAVNLCQQSVSMELTGSAMRFGSGYGIPNVEHKAAMEVATEQ
jgi:hypothetical protein